MKQGNKHAQKGTTPASEKIALRVTPEKKELYKSIAAKNNLSLSEWIQTALDAAAAEDK